MAKDNKGLKDYLSPSQKPRTPIYGSEINYPAKGEKLLARTPLEDYIDMLVEIRSEKKDLNYLDRKKREEETVNDFLKRHVNISYEEFVRISNPESIEENSFGTIVKPAQKKSLFNARAILYLSALDNFEKAGGNINDILDSIREGYVPLVKKSKGKEPTFEAIYRVLKVKVGY